MFGIILNKFFSFAASLFKIILNKIMKKIYQQALVLAAFILAFQHSQAQNSETQNTSVSQSLSKTSITGYGEFKFQYRLEEGTGTANMTRAVVYVGHRFTDKISLTSEFELEDAKLEGGEPGGEFNLEQLYLKFELNREHYLVAGLFIPRIGILNENHMPNTFNGNDRPFVERLIIPSTWREMGVGLYGSMKSVPGLNYSAGIMNGLNASEFDNSSGIRSGRQGGKDATATNLALTAALLYNTGDWRFQVSGYYGGSTGIPDEEADTLHLDNGIFGTPVLLGECNITYSKPLFSIKALAATINIPDADKLNMAYSNNTAQMTYGAYLEGALNLCKVVKPSSDKKLDLFMRYEIVNLNADMPSNGISNKVNEKNYLVTGLSYLPAKEVVIKADYVWNKTGKPAGITDFTNTHTFINVGAGYSF